MCILELSNSKKEFKLNTETREYSDLRLLAMHHKLIYFAVQADILKKKYCDECLVTLKLLQFTCLVDGLDTQRWCSTHQISHLSFLMGPKSSHASANSPQMTCGYFPFNFACTNLQIKRLYIVDQNWSSQSNGTELCTKLEKWP